MSLFNWGNKRKAQEETIKAQGQQIELLKSEIEALKTKPIEVEDKSVVVSPGASSRRDIQPDTYNYLDTSLQVITPDFQMEVIPIIRKLAKINPDISQAYNDTVRLANTGHTILFDPRVSSQQIDEMRSFIEEASKSWHVGAAGMNGIVNKMFRQLLIGGALSTEWIPNFELDNLEQIRFVDPETIRFIQTTKSYHPYQKLRHTWNLSNPMFNLKKLNTVQYKYYAYNGDTDTPYGYPPYLAALDAIATQKNMISNIKYIVECLGVMGYLDAKIAKPDQQSGESEQAYAARLKQFLTDFKTVLQNGMRDGVSVGFQGEHEYEFKQTAKTAQGATELFDQNEQLIASGLQFDSAFMGRPGSETVVTILFTKMIAQLVNSQNIVAENLEYGYKLALKLAGFKFKTLKVRFKRSTITDDLKFQQAEEIKIRNCMAKYNYGVISLDQMADELGYETPDQKEPRIDINNVDVSTGAVKKQQREDQKDKSARSSRAKSKPGAVRKTKPTKNA